MKVREMLELTKALFEKMERVDTEEERRDIRNQVVELNIRLVPHMLKKYRPYTDDMYQNACIGLIKAADSYDLTRGVPFPNYACFCVTRELQLRHKYEARTFEYQCGFNLSSLQEIYGFDGTEDVSLEDQIADESAEAAFMAIFQQAGLDSLFYNCILPAIDGMASRECSLDMDLWKNLEIQYIFEMAQERNRGRRLTFTAMAKQLGTTTQNIRTRHARLMDTIKDQCRRMGYVI